MPLTTNDFPMVPGYRPHQFPTTIVLKRGSHRLPSDGSCAMEVARLVAGYPWVRVGGPENFPESFCPVLSTALMYANDNLNDVERQKLLPYVVKMEGTVGDRDIEIARAKAICDVVGYKYDSHFAPEHNAVEAIVRSSHQRRQCVAFMEPASFKWSTAMSETAMASSLHTVWEEYCEQGASSMFRALDAAFAIGPQAGAVVFEHAIKRAESAINSHRATTLPESFRPINDLTPLKTYV